MQISYKFWQCPNSIPECIASQLRSCTIISSCFLEDDVQFAIDILRNAPLLWVMTIIARESTLTFAEERQISFKLFTCLKISSTCRVALQINGILW